MEKLACEMCGSTNIVKQDGLYICQSCGTKYSPEEAKKMMSEGTVDVKGTVKVDNSSEIENLHTLLHRSINDNQWKEVADYSNKILIKNPNDYEAIFYKELGEMYSANLKNMNFELADLKSASENSLNIISDENIDVNIEDVKLDFAKKINTGCVAAFNAATNHYNKYPANSSINIYYNTLENCMILTDYAVNLTKLDKKGKIAMCKNIVTYSQGLTKKLSYSFGTQKKILQANSTKRTLAVSYYNKYTNQLSEIDSSYKPPAVKKKKGGCYIATSVYGSYDCPEVWTLRRYRDNYLSKSLPGKLFIKIYYKTSPTIVKWFGDKKWFNQIFKNRLDKKVEKLQKHGVDCTYYVD